MCRCRFHQAWNKETRYCQPIRVCKKPLVSKKDMGRTHPNTQLLLQLLTLLQPQPWPPKFHPSVRLFLVLDDGMPPVYGGLDSAYTVTYQGPSGYFRMSTRLAAGYRNRPFSCAEQESRTVPTRSEVSNHSNENPDVRNYHSSLSFFLA